MDRVIAHVEAQDLGGNEINSLLRGKADVKLFDSLQGATVASFFTMPAVALLFPVQSMSQGHWLAIFMDHDTKTIHHFDPYGFGLAMEEKYTQNPLVRAGLLSTFYQNAQSSGYNVVFNSTKFQKLENNMNTCGRHVITRIRLSYLSDDEYSKLLMGQKLTADDIVTYLTFLALNEDQSDVAQVKTTLLSVPSGGAFKQDPTAAPAAAAAAVIEAAQPAGADDADMKSAAAQANEEWDQDSKAADRAKWKEEDDDNWDEEWLGAKPEVIDTKPAREIPLKRINIDDSSSSAKRQKES